MPNSALIAVLGPTGAGKSTLALRIADTFDGEIVNFDSVQVYKGLDIGSAKLPPGERLGIPHHLLDVVQPGCDFTAGAFARLAGEVLPEIVSRGKLPVLVGGTGFYLRSLLDGLSPAPGRDQELRERLDAVRTKRPDALHRLLRRLDPESSRRIHANDHQKLIRAIELAKTFPERLPRPGLPGYSVLKLGLNPPREELNARLNQRCAAMFESGLLDETQRLLDSGVPAHCRALQTIGYKQAVAVLEGRLEVDSAITETQTRTRQYAKRQMTWFRREAGVHWLKGFGENANLTREALRIVGIFLRSSGDVA